MLTYAGVCWRMLCGVIYKHNSCATTTCLSACGLTMRHKQFLNNRILHLKGHAQNLKAAYLYAAFRLIQSATQVFPPLGLCSKHIRCGCFGCRQL